MRSKRSIAKSRISRMHGARATPRGPHHSTRRTVFALARPVTSSTDALNSKPHMINSFTDGSPGGAGALGRGDADHAAWRSAADQGLHRPAHQKSEGQVALSSKRTRNCSRRPRSRCRITQYESVVFHRSSAFLFGAPPIEGL